MARQLPECNLLTPVFVSLSQPPLSMNTALLQQAANEARGLAMDAVSAAKSGHLGLPLGCAEIGAILFGQELQSNPEDPHWINRDRFVLSAGHGSMFLYAWLHLAGYDLPINAIKNFRQLHSTTPGHPEYGETPGVEATTGPLGQGVGNAVGMAIAAKMAAATFNTKDFYLFDHHIVCLAGDGCLQEGVAAEASAYAGHLGLDNLILIYDANDVTLDAMGYTTQSEDTSLRYRAYGFNVVTIDGHDLDALLQSFQNAKYANNGKPHLIIVKTLIAKGIPEIAGSVKGHGEYGIAFVKAARKALNLPDEKFYVSQAVKAYFAEHKHRQIKIWQKWEHTLSAYRDAHPDRYQQLYNGLHGILPDPSPASGIDRIPPFPKDATIATRKAGGQVLQHFAQTVPMLISGSADLHSSTLNYIEGGGDFTEENPTGRNLRFGIREHAMGAILNGIAYYGLHRASGATFMTFSDYLRPSIRLAALAKLPVFYILTHDSIGVGEDGPTHQPVETVSALRCIPNLDVIRPADPEETAGAFYAALERKDGPTALSLTRQAVPTLNDIPITARRQGVLKGGYIARKESSQLERILMATGSELQHALAAATQLGTGTRVVSLPCFERFERQPTEYRESILPASCRQRVAIDSGIPGLWYRYTGLDGKVIAVDRFGLSAPGETVMRELGITAEKIIAACST